MSTVVRKNNPDTKLYAELKDLGDGVVRCARCGIEGSFGKLGHCIRCRSITKVSKVESAKLDDHKKHYVALNR